MGEPRQDHPAFLDFLEGDPERAFRDLHELAWRLLTVCPPSTFQNFRREEREDLIADTIFHCVKDGFRVLKTYCGGSFAGWLSTVARNRSLDEIRRRSRRIEVPLPPDTPTADSAGTPIRADEPLQDQRREWAHYLERVRGCIDKMGKKCQILLWASAEGLQPREIQRLLGAGSGSNKTVSDDLRYCRERLKKLLQKEGLDWSSVAAAGFDGRRE